jgi:hypothetical protein
VIWRSRHSAAERDTLRVSIPDAPLAHFHHFCHASGQVRLLGVAFTDMERSALAAGDDVVIVLACDRCIWEALVAFRLAS